MKKILLLCLMVIAVSSCTTSTYTYSYKGDVELLSNDGRLIEKWNNAVFSEGDSSVYIVNHNISYKNSGLEFLTEEGDYMYINGGIIIVRDIRKNIQINPVEDFEKYEEENRDYL